LSQLLSPTIADDQPLERVSVRRNPWLKLPKWILVFLALLWIADIGISLLIQHTRFRDTLTQRLETGFGRPVQVGSYNFSLWGGPVLQAQSVTVAEDPRFGHEYFLRAESITVRLLWSSLLRGRIGLGTLSLTRPSLNLVRDSQGDWNISEWLPIPARSSVPAAQTGIGPQLAVRAPSFRRIEIQGGRINFKRVDEKLPYAFANVTGAVEAESLGRWRLDLQAAPWRAATVLQQVGTLHLTGNVGGTSSRLLPAALQLSWTDASLPDVLRLARGDDNGLRGTFAAVIVASTVAENWNFQVRTELRQLHRWDLALRPDNPAVNIISKLRWNPHVQELDLTDVAIEAPHSHAHAAGKIYWGQLETRPNPSSAPDEKSQVQIVSAAVDLQDALSWLRAFRSGISNGVNIRGVAGAQVSLGGWPPRIEQGSFSTGAAELTEAGLRVPVHLGPATINVLNNAFSLSTSTTLSFGDEASSLRIYEAGSEARAGAPKSKSAPSHFHVTGKMAQVRDLISTASLFGWNLSRGWDISGPVMCDLQWQGGPSLWKSPPTGFVEWGAADRTANGTSLSAPFLNQPVSQIAARVDLKPGATHIALASAQAFAAHWNGTLDRREPADGWRFALTADHLDASILNEWLNPRSRENFLDRMLPFFNGRAQTIAAPEGLRAAGHIVVDQFTLSPLVVNRLEGDLALDGRHISLANASGQFFGGAVDGSLDADLAAIPAYRADVNFSRADLSALLAASPSLSTLTADSASGAVSFETHGATRSDLLSALTCDGKASINNLGLSGIDLLGSIRLSETKPGASEFQDASATFSCVNAQLHLEDIQLAGANMRLGGSGTVDSNRNLDIRLRILSDDAVGPRLAKSTVAPGQLYHLTGTLAEPQFAPVQSSPAPRRPR
jgi:hypothetical protein